MHMSYTACYDNNTIRLLVTSILFIESVTAILIVEALDAMYHLSNFSKLI